MKAKCVAFYEFGNPEEVLRIAHKEIESPKDDEVLVRMIARPINPSDIIPIRGAYSHRITLPNIPGYEGVGIVEDIGSAVSRNLLGKRVLPLRGEGTWQEYVKTTEKYTVPVPNSIDHFTAAQMYINPLTAWVICTQKLRLQPNDVLLVNACGSSIGHLFAQLSRIIGFRLIAITRNNHYTKELKRLGAYSVIHTSNQPLQKTVMELTNGKGADAAIDSIGGSDGNELAFCLRNAGTFLTLGLLSGVQVDWARIMKKAKVHAKLFHLRHWNKKVTINMWQETFQHIITLFQSGDLHVIQPKTYYELTDIRKAVQAATTLNGSQGKVMLINDADRFIPTSRV